MSSKHDVFSAHDRSTDKPDITIDCTRNATERNNPI